LAWLHWESRGVGNKRKSAKACGTKEQKGKEGDLANEREEDSQLNYYGKGITEAARKSGEGENMPGFP